MVDAKTHNSENIFGFSNIILLGPFGASFATLWTTSVPEPP